jgi:hypothetical protein
MKVPPDMLLEEKHHTQQKYTKQMIQINKKQCTIISIHFKYGMILASLSDRDASRNAIKNSLVVQGQ